MAEKIKYYVVWKGAKPGVYRNWSDCEMQIKGFTGALYKSFPSLAEAEKAFKEKPHLHLNTAEKKVMPSASIIRDSISVDGACSSNEGMMEYRGVHTGTKQVVFAQGPFRHGTNNIAEFLALVHVLALCKQKGWNYPIYTDSKTALAWIRNKKANTKCDEDDDNQEIFDLIQRAEKWLQSNTWTNQILKWDTEHWGEIPADYGRK
ncbi:MAG: ribonuclease H [Bacteroidetes bacterium HGW-Bacteroidetes-21]|jgi:ribonuclease HI|nr:MAG: ribonuclease H [Bacteroidetes bacterium HGW-Bacteroidetes-21]